MELVSFNVDHKKSTGKRKAEAIKRSPVIQAFHWKVDLSQYRASSSGKPT
jgi:hypothetical protein